MLSETEGAQGDMLLRGWEGGFNVVRRFLPEHWSFKASDSIKRLREGAGFTTSPDES